MPLLPLIPNATATDAPRKDKEEPEEEEREPLLAKSDADATKGGEAPRRPGQRGARHSLTGAVVLTTLLLGGLTWSIGQATYKLSTSPPPPVPRPLTGQGEPPQHGATAGNPHIPTPTRRNREEDTTDAGSLNNATALVDVPSRNASVARVEAVTSGNNESHTLQMVRRAGNATHRQRELPRGVTMLFAFGRP